MLMMMLRRQVEEDEEEDHSDGSLKRGRRDGKAFNIHSEYHILTSIHHWAY